MSQYTNIPAASSGGGGNTVLTRAQALVPSANFDTVLGTDFDHSAWYGTVHVGSATSTLSVTDSGGVMNLASGAAASGVSGVFPSGAPSYVANAQTTAWYFYGRFKLNSADANTQTGLGLSAISGGTVANPVLLFGGLGMISTTNFSWRTTDAGGTTIAGGTGPTLDSSWHTIEMYNDGTTITFLFDGVSIGTTPASNISAVPMMIEAQAVNGTTAVNRTQGIDKMWLVVKGN